MVPLPSCQVVEVSDYPRGQVVAAQCTTDALLRLQGAQDPQSRAVARLADGARGPDHVVKLAAGAELITCPLGNAVIPPPAQLVKAGGHSEEGYFVAAKGLVLTL
jgi:hypothetical protein